MRHFTLIIGMLMLAAWAPVLAESLPLSLDQCVDEGLTRGPAAQLAANAWDQAERTYAQVLAGNGLSLAASGTYELGTQTVGTGSQSTIGGSQLTFGSGNLKLDDPNHTLSAKVSASGPTTSVGLSASQIVSSGKTLSQSDTSLNLSLNQTLFDGYVGGKQAAAVEKARIALEQQRLTLFDALNTVRYEVRSAYLNLLGAYRIVAAKAEGYRKLQAAVDRTQALKDAKMATALELSQAQTAAAGGELDWAAAKNDQAIALGQLAILLGREWTDQFTIQDLPNETEEPAERAKLLATALANRTEPKTVAFDKAAAQIDLELKKANTRLGASLTGGVNWRHGWANSQDALSLSAVANISVPLVDNGANAAQIALAEKALSAQDIKAAQATITVTQDLDTALFAFRDASARRILAERQRADAQEAWDQGRLKQDAGLVTAADVQDLLLADVQAESALATAMKTEALARLNLKKAQGIGL